MRLLSEQEGHAGSVLECGSYMQLAVTWQGHLEGLGVDQKCDRQRDEDRDRERDGENGL